jgi:hypothetical protein
VACLLAGAPDGDYVFVPSCSLHRGTLFAHLDATMDTVRNWQIGQALQIALVDLDEQSDRPKRLAGGPAVALVVCGLLIPRRSPWAEAQTTKGLLASPLPQLGKGSDAEPRPGMRGGRLSRSRRIYPGGST